MGNLFTTDTSLDLLPCTNLLLNNGQATPISFVSPIHNILRDEIFEVLLETSLDDLPRVQTPLRLLPECGWRYLEIVLFNVCVHYVHFFLSCLVLT